MLQVMVLFADFKQYLFGSLLFLTSAFLILLVLIQRGRGGGLAGAFGGMGGQSAFGTKAGDLFTRVTMVTAAIWILLAVAAIKFMGGASSQFGGINTGPASITASPGDAEENSASDGQDSGSATGGNAGGSGVTETNSGGAGSAAGGNGGGEAEAENQP